MWNYDFIKNRSRGKNFVIFFTSPDTIFISKEHGVSLQGMFSVIFQLE